MSVCETSVTYNPIVLPYTIPPRPHLRTGKKPQPLPQRLSRLVNEAREAHLAVPPRCAVHIAEATLGHERQVVKILPSDAPLGTNGTRASDSDGPG
jgi:hypothetical protein